MDFKKLAGQASSFLDKNKTPAATQAPPAQTAPPAGGSAPAGTAAPAQKEDYGDKAFGMFAKQTGHKVDQGTSEKITDGARGLFEKFSGKKVDPKYSN